MNDAAIDLIRSAQVRAGKPIFGTEFTNPDFSRIAQAFGLDFYQVANETACQAAVQAAVTAARPTLIEALIDPPGIQRRRSNKSDFGTVQVRGALAIFFGK